MKQFHLESGKIEFLKYLAVFFMILDHYSSLFLDSYSLLKIIGRFVFPLFSIILVYNYIYNTKNKFLYIKRLLIFAILSEPFHYYAFKDYFPGYTFNIFLTLGLGLTVIYILEKIRDYNLPNKLLIYFYLIMFLPFTVFLSYPIYGILLILSTYIFIKKTNYITLFLVCLMIYLNNFSWHYVYSLVGLLAIIIVYINPFEIKIRINKYFFYAIYPLHLFILALCLNF